MSIRAFSHISRKTVRDHGTSGGRRLARGGDPLFSEDLESPKLLGFRPTSQNPQKHSKTLKKIRRQELLGVEADEKYNVPVGVAEKLGKNLLLNESHPLGILWTTAGGRWVLGLGWGLFGVAAKQLGKCILAFGSASMNL